MKLFAIALLAAVTVVAQAQSAKVVALDKEDATEAKSLFDQKAALDKKIADLEEKITKKYLTIEEVYPTAASICLTTNSTWTNCSTTPPKPEPVQQHSGVFRKIKDFEYGFQYSEDFKYVVPSSYKPPVTTNCSPNWVTPVWGSGLPAYMNFSSVQ